MGTLAGRLWLTSWRATLIVGPSLADSAADRTAVLWLRLFYTRLATQKPLNPALLLLDPLLLFDIPSFFRHTETNQY